MSDLRHGARSAHNRSRSPRGGRRGTAKHGIALLGRSRAHRPLARDQHGLLRVGARFRREPRFCMAATGPGGSSCAVGRRPVLRTWLEVVAHAKSQHVHVNRHGHRRGICLQLISYSPAYELASGKRPRHGTSGHLFRSERSHYRFGPIRPGDGASRPQPDQQRNSSASRSRS